MNWDSSRIEGFFGHFKTNYGYEKGTISRVIQDMNNFCGLNKTQSASRIDDNTKEFENLPININLINTCGTLAIKILKKEAEAVQKGYRYPLATSCVWCHLRNQNNPLALPCRHVLQPDQTIDVAQFHSRFLRKNNNYPVVQNTVCISKQPRHTKMTRSCILARLDQYLPYYDTNSDIRGIFDETLTKLNEAAVHPNTGMPPTIAQKGRAFLHPSHHVLGGAEKTKKQYHCSICHEAGP